MSLYIEICIRTGIQFALRFVATFMPFISISVLDRLALCFQMLSNHNCFCNNQLMSFVLYLLCCLLVLTVESLIVIVIAVLH